MARHHHRGPHARVGGEASGGDRPLLVRDQDADVESLGLDAGGHAGGAECSRQRRRIELRDVGWSLHPAGAEEAHSSPSVSGRPSIKLRSWTPWPAAPFQRLSMAANAIVLSPTTVTWTRQRFVLRTWLVCGGSSATSTKGSSS